MSPETRWTKHGKKPRNANRRRNSPIPWLAWHIAQFNAKNISKANLASARAAVADRLMALSEPWPKRERL